MFSEPGRFAVSVPVRAVPQGQVLLRGGQHGVQVWLVRWLV
ncbi:MAG: hypothetical protein AAF821_05155 [Cyanobacteria bacterium P01_D01_bin.156]